MVPGLWLEPEVVGVRSPMAERLPDEAFLQRDGVRRRRARAIPPRPAAPGRPSRTSTRSWTGSSTSFGIGYFKFDYNIDPGAGTDRDADSLGDGLLRPQPRPPRLARPASSTAIPS